jgi:Iap family predicted aminopeptidase
VVYHLPAQTDTACAARRTFSLGSLFKRVIDRLRADVITVGNARSFTNIWQEITVPQMTSE